MASFGKQENLQDIIAWVNQQLRAAGYSDQVVTDIGVDFVDGITLIRLVQYITGRSVGHHHSNPLMRGQKLENITLCLKFLHEMGCTVRVRPEDIVSGDINSIALLCSFLKYHFRKASPHLQPDRSKYQSKPPKNSISSLGPDDRELFGWVSQIVHQNITEYANFYDGSILCDLVNSFKNKAIDYNDLTNLTPVQCLQVAFSAAESHLGITKGSIDINELVSGREDQKLKSYLQHFRMIYQHEAKRKLRSSILEDKVPPSSIDTTASLHRPERNAKRLSDKIRSKRATSEAYLNMASDQGPNKMRHSISSEYLNTQKIMPPRMKGQPQEYGTNYDPRVNAITRTNDNRYGSSTLPRPTPSDTGLPVTIYRTSSRSSIYSTSSRSSDRYDDYHLSLTNLANLSHSSLAEHLENYQETSNIHSSSGVTASSGIPGSSGIQSSGSVPGITGSNGGVSEQSLDDIKDRLKELTLLIEEEKTEVIHKLMTVVIKERKSRQSLEKQHKQLMKKANYVMQHYDGCLVDLAKDVAHIKQQVQHIQEQISDRLSSQDELVILRNEMEMLKKQVITGNTTNQHQQQPSLYEAVPSSTSDKRKTLFSRKKSEKT